MKYPIYNITAESFQRFFEKRVKFQLRVPPHFNSQSKETLEGVIIKARLIESHGDCDNVCYTRNIVVSFELETESGMRHCEIYHIENQVIEILEPVMCLINPFQVS